MEPLFRLALIRPAVAQDPANPSIPTAQESDFQQALADALRTQRPREAAQRIARAFVASEDFLGSPAETPASRALAELAAALDELERRPQLARQDVVDAVERTLGDAPAALVENPDLQRGRARLRDSILAIKQLPEEHGRPIEALVGQLRDLELLDRLAEDDAFPGSGAELRRYRRRSLELPQRVGLASVLSTAALREERRKRLAEAEAERVKRAEGLLAEHRRLSAAIDDLAGLGPEHFQTTPQAPHVGFDPPAGLQAEPVLARRAEYLKQLSELSLKQLQVSIDRDGVDPLRAQGVAGAASAARLADAVLSDRPRLLAGSPAFRPMALGEVTFRLRDSAAEALSDGTRSALAERGLALAERPLDRLVEVLEGAKAAAARELDVLYGPTARRSIKRIGGTLVTVSTQIPTRWADIVVGPLPFPPVGAPEPEPIESIPHTRGRVAPSGVADLLIVRQQLVGYEGADVAHIENVLLGESKLREHLRRRETEELTFRETEVTTSEERELESTSRFEMTRETSTTIREDATLKAGLTVSGKYGPSVEFSASAEGSVSRSKEEATRAASSFSQDVTERSATKITERVLERASLRVTNEVTEKNVHELSNVGGSGHISGVYQWVSKVYQAQMFNYGLRTMFDFMVPEPAAFLMEALRSALASSTELEKPPEFPLRPKDVNEENYHHWVRVYGATDVAPPPERYKTKSLDFKAGGGDDGANYSHSGQLTIDEGYRAMQGAVGRVSTNWGSINNIVDIALGRRVTRFTPPSPWVWVTDLDGERDSIPFALVTLNIAEVAVAVEVKCERTERAMEKWRAETHARLTTAYRARLAEYEEKLAALEMQSGIAIQGRHPLSNLEIVSDELKKNCVSILTDQHFDLFDAIDPSAGTSLPQIDVSEAEAEGAYVRFFEHAFEWEHMTWVTYPYFWGRKGQWAERLGFEDPDPLFNQFLKSGYCRVSVPARPGFEGAIDHFMTYGDLWNGGALPPISSDLYLPIADELAERLDRPADEVPQGDPWLVRIPTTLVRLRADDALPRWQQDANGNWVEA